jgi:hypothetical protein
MNACRFQLIELHSVPAAGCQDIGSGGLAARNLVYKSSSLSDGDGAPSFIRTAVASRRANSPRENKSGIRIPAPRPSALR